MVKPIPVQIDRRYTFVDPSSFFALIVRHLFTWGHPTYVNYLFAFWINMVNPEFRGSVNIRDFQTKRGINEGLGFNPREIARTPPERTGSFSIWNYDNLLPLPVAG
jgi:hypothetical protein